MPRQRRPSAPPPGPPSEERLDGALRYSSEVERSRARSTRRRPLPARELFPSVLEALARAKVAGESAQAALKLVREVRRSDGMAGLGLDPAEELLANAGSELAQVQGELERFLGRPTPVDGAVVAPGAFRRGR